MTRRKEVSEKSLELNVCAEILQYIRSWSGCEGALWFGLTQANERQMGIDEMIQNVGPGVSLMLQFKAPWPTSVVDDLYKFSINEQQHFALEQLAATHPDSVYYVFPLYSKWSKANSYAPNLVRDTWIVKVTDIPYSSLAGSAAPSNTRHNVELERVGANMLYTVFSPEVRGSGINAEQFFEQQSIVNQMKAGAAGIPGGALLDWIGYLKSQDAPPRFKGLHAVFVPQGQVLG